MLFWRRFTASMILLFLWPPALAGQLLQFLGDRRAAPRALESVYSYQQKARYSLPFSGEWYVLNGGPDEGSSHSWDVVAHRYAYDFVVADGALRRWREEAEGRELGDYLGYGEPVLPLPTGWSSRRRTGSGTPHIPAPVGRTRSRGTSQATTWS